jgi:DNA mismatch endonuclease, patch repair protein
VADIVDQKTRSRMMSGIKGKDTKPEIAVRRFLHRQGFRYRLHASELSGKPDIVLPKYRTAIFVHGCFWHQHPNCPFAAVPQTNKAFWRKKLAANVERDKKAIDTLRKQGWRVLIVWECETRSEEQLHSLPMRIWGD